MTVKVTKAMHSQAVSDLDYIVKKYGDVDDFCGAFCNSEKYDELLRNPTIEMAYNHIVSLLRHHNYVGNEQGEMFDVKDSRTGKIIKKYCL
ncbi:hypothetical protein [Shewanella sp.]|uniref:hypothetical protein n=1 Tax=Shewanella sp. TaxID=50422 RepID=UPI001B5B1980|nr:hypothetical protein [Shewanella sp.]MBP6517883.1 hypothetical protein [Shewanella sp.]